MAKGEIAAAGNAASLEALISRAAPVGKGLPPVERWNPHITGDLDMEIRSDGSWLYQATPITRPALVRLFSTVLRKDEDGKTYLVTPVEKVAIRVEDAPFTAVEMSAGTRDGEQVLTFRTNVGDIVEAGPDHPLRFEIAGENDELKPYLLVRGRLEALLTRALVYDLVELAQSRMIEGAETFSISSGGEVFAIMPTDRLEALSHE
ncbi:DUF1285 domain-containing protein [Hoeflea prorocentri]|uniref:DUF1285 domain-containing protein n=1 Tax=Hoeflea prorocentri TaxID=1922333 RepID=A0A9X3ZG43_9HYPH|nr:DUF1285 domain-containing protein [Hoeflea prorocentri]MCY6379528.1 DUF1285 domain-containing protein [Hoeflea prorocentri]MDA5397328.1 DUF1285 domain-containing protein [Hoeflea prorocentri]